MPLRLSQEVQYLFDQCRYGCAVFPGRSERPVVNRSLHRRQILQGDRIQGHPRRVLAFLWNDVRVLRRRGRGRRERDYRQGRDRLDRVGALIGE